MYICRVYHKILTPHTCVHRHSETIVLLRIHVCSRYIKLSLNTHLEGSIMIACLFLMVCGEYTQWVRVSELSSLLVL